MANFTERQEHKIEIIPPHSFLQVRRSDIIEKDGKEVGRTYHRTSFAPGDDVSDEVSEVQAVAAAVWTPGVIAAWEAFNSSGASA
jgi:hypothetical protein